MTSIGYRSTRSDGGAEPLGFGDVLLAGLAPDGGLYCPTTIPRLGDLPAVGADTPYVEAAVTILEPFCRGTFDAGELETMATEAYRSFRHPDICPVIELGPDRHLVDLTKGPTLAFKDVALQMVGRMLEAELARRGHRITIVGATSGDTGSAAIEALAGAEGVEVLILHPHERVSEIQRRQMTTVGAANIHNVAIRGTFDDCQDLVKASFADDGLRHEVGLAAVNSINWARVLCQIVYYVTSARRVRPDGGPVSFSVPTGNFGNVLSGWYAKRMGLEVDQLIVASNRNDVLTRYLETGRLETRTVEPSLSPSMDIQVSSNFERALWEASDRDGPAVAQLLTDLRSTGSGRRPRSVAGGSGGRLHRGPTRRRWHPWPDRRHPRRERAGGRPAHRGWAVCGRPPRRARGADADLGHRRPGQVSRRGRAGHRDAAPAPAPRSRDPAQARAL